MAIIFPLEILYIYIFFFALKSLLSHSLRLSTNTLDLQVFSRISIVATGLSRHVQTSLSLFHIILPRSHLLDIYLEFSPTEAGLAWNFRERGGGALTHGFWVLSGSSLYLTWRRFPEKFPVLSCFTAPLFTTETVGQEG